jgi:DnaK suppressor protein
MNKRKLQKFRKLYQSILDDLMDVIKKRVEEELDVDGDEVDRIQGQNILSMAQKLSTRESLKVERIEQALKKMDEGTFGECEECGEQIGDRRLEAIPGVDICVACAEIEEKAARNFA